MLKILMVLRIKPEHKEKGEIKRVDSGIWWPGYGSPYDLECLGRIDWKIDKPKKKSLWKRLIGRISRKSTG